MVIQKIVTVLWLALLSIEDIQKKQVCKKSLLFGVILTVIVLLYRWIDSSFQLLDTGKSLVPGSLLLMIAFLTRKVGVADGIVLLCIGLQEGYQNCMLIATVGLAVSSFISAILLVMKKVNHNTEIPFLPFLSFGWLLVNGVKNYG